MYVGGGEYSTPTPSTKSLSMMAKNILSIWGIDYEHFPVAVIFS